MSAQYPYTTVVLFMRQQELEYRRGRPLVWCRYVVNSTHDLGVFLRIWNWYILSIELNLKFKIIPSVSFNVEAVEIKHFYKYFNGYNKSK